MKYIQTRRANCKDCYKCITNCLVKSISYDNDRVEIIDDGCVLCGRCITICPRNAKRLENDLSCIQEILSDKTQKLCASLSPDFIAAYGNNAFKLITALRNLGFDFVEETSIGGACVTEEYRRLILRSQGENIISSACPTINMFIKKYYPDLVPYLAPVLTPIEVHAALIKTKYGKDTHVIGIGPCLSMLDICDKNENIDGYITYTQLDKWFESNNVNLDELAESSFDEQSTYSRIYPTQGGITKDIINIFDNNEGTEKAGNYDLLSASGLENAKKMLDELKRGTVSNVFAEIWGCEGGCIGAPFMPKISSGRYERRIKVKDYADKAIPAGSCLITNVKTEHKPEPYVEVEPSEEEIQALLEQMGKYTKAQELNCGICGYATCREKAIAVYRHKADIHTCMPYLLNISRSLSYTVLSVTPNIIIAADSAMNIKEFNETAQNVFKIARYRALGKKVSDIIDDTDFRYVVETKTNIYDKKVEFKNQGIIASQTIMYSLENDIVIAIIKDITTEEYQRQKMYDKKMKSLALAQDVIDKQMFVAQQIAGLLGETTAETKVALSTLKDMIAVEENDKNDRN